MTKLFINFINIDLEDLGAVLGLLLNTYVFVLSEGTIDYVTSCPENLFNTTSMGFSYLYPQYPL
jgi:hypothetical protein